MVRGGVAASRYGCASHSCSQCARVILSARASKKPRWQLSTDDCDSLNSLIHRLQRVIVGGCERRMLGHMLLGVAIGQGGMA